MELTQCPYDGQPIDAETFSGGSVLLSCPACGAEWEWHSSLVRRIREPDRTAVMRSRILRIEHTPS